MASEVPAGRARTLTNEDISQSKNNLKKTATRRPSFLTEEDLSGVGKVFADKEGDLEAIAAASGIELRLLEWDPPTDATDFARKILQGTYTVDMAEEAKVQLRSCIRGEIREAAKSLKKTETKTWDGEASAQEVELFSKKYEEKKGNLAQLAEIYGLSLPLLEATKPANAEDFAKKLLLGLYTPEAIAVAARAMREEMKDSFKEGNVPKLKKSSTKESDTTPSPGQVALLANIYTEKKGNLQQLAATFGADFEELARSPPKDANDFALNLMRGQYSNRETQYARERLNSYVLKELQQGRVLKQAPRTRTDSTIKREEIEHAAALFTKHEGNLEKIAAELSLDLALLKKDSPTEKDAFAEKLWAGVYVG